MRYLLLVLVLVACSSSTDLKAGDPSILVTNDLPSSWVYVTWKDGQGTIGRDSVAARTTKCVRFLAQPDSAYWEASATQNNSTTTVRSPTWFNPTDRPAWSLRAFSGTGSLPYPELLQEDVASEC